ncbi:WGR domain-containing protein [Arvimicrobium flavum]|uniref:WGR domain-containing protein n=1 Tax=Arvimicrobium flavum TaxID=3393320 RepID=UPI00237C5177|nr:WGR domain-containing protein [Mesorhizobium shangrilense]
MPHHAIMSRDTDASVLLHRIDASKNMARFYAMHVSPTLFGESCVTRNWGRIGTRGRTRLDTFATAPEAEAALRRLQLKKNQRGYRSATKTPTSSHKGEHKDLCGSAEIGESAIRLGSDFCRGCHFMKPPRRSSRPSPSNPDSTRTPDEAPTILQFRVWLKGLSPMVWRRVQVPATMALREFHGVLQIVMGWEGSSSCILSATAHGS